MTEKQHQQDTTPQPQRTKSTGDWGESVAAEHLVSLGYALRESKWKGNGFEIDLVMQHGTRIVFVEVKTRHGAADPVEAVDGHKRERMIRAADIYLRALGVPFDYQFDIIAITGTPHNYTLEHIPDAFFPTPRSRFRR